MTLGPAGRTAKPLSCQADPTVLALLLLHKPGADACGLVCVDAGFV